MAIRGPKKGNTRIDFDNAKVLQQVTDLVSKGYTEASIAKAFGYAPTHFSELKRNHPKLAEAIKMGRFSVEQLVQDKIFSMMLDDKHPKQFNALVFYAKCKLGWNDRSGQVFVTEGPAKTTSLSFVQEVADADSD